MKPVARFFNVLPPKFLQLAFCLLWVTLSITNQNLVAQSAIQWDKTIGGDNFEDLRAIFETPDGGFIYGASTSSNANGDISQANNGFSDYWIGKLDANGNLLWEINYGGDNRPVTSAQTNSRWWLHYGWIFKIFLKWRQVRAEY